MIFTCEYVCWYSVWCGWCFFHPISQFLFIEHFLQAAILLFCCFFYRKLKPMHTIQSFTLLGNWFVSFFALLLLLLVLSCSRNQLEFYLIVQFFLTLILFLIRQIVFSANLINLSIDLIHYSPNNKFLRFWGTNTFAKNIDYWLLKKKKFFPK